MTFFVHRITVWYPKILKFLSSKSMMSQLSKTVSTVVERLLDRFLSSFEISSKMAQKLKIQNYENHVILMKFQTNLKIDLKVVQRQSTRFQKAETPNFTIRKFWVPFGYHFGYHSVLKTRQKSQNLRKSRFLQHTKMPPWYPRWYPNGTQNVEWYPNGTQDGTQTS